MKRVRLNFFAQLLAIISVIAIGLGIFTATQTKAADVSESYDISFTMDVGASLRIGETDGNNGLKYTAKMTKADYDSLMTNVGEDKTYAYVNFGMLIAPADYDLSYDKVFGANASYRWDLFDEDAGVWNGTYLGGNTSGKVIINIYGQDLHEAVDAKTEQTYMEFRGGSMVNIRAANLTRNFRGIGYIELTKANGDKDYIMATANDNVRMPYYIASVYVSGDYGLTESQISWLKSNYLDNSTVVANSTTNIGLNGDDEIDLSAYGLPTGSYDYYVQQYIEKTYYDSGYNYYKDYIGDREEASTTGTIVDVSGLEGTYAITAAFEGTTYGYTFLVDHYTPGTFVWNNVADYDKSVRVSNTYGKQEISSQYITGGYIADKTGTPAEGRSGDYYYVTATSYNDLKTQGIDGIGFRIIPVHSKAYYQTLFAGKSIMLDYYYTKGGETSDTLWQFCVGYDLGTTDLILDYAQLPDSWAGRSGWLGRNSISINTMLSNWRNVINGTAGSGAGSMVGLRNAVNASSYVEVTETCEGEVTFYFGNVHLSSNSMTYTEECYDLNDELIKTTNKTAALGTSVTMTPGAIDGYVYVPGHAGNELNGTIIGNNLLTLKAYYATSTSEDLTDGYTAIITDNSYSFASHLTASVSSYTVTQYVVKDLDNDGTIDYVGVDVTSVYTDLITDDVLDMTSFDGIYKVTATTPDGSQHAVLFERKIDGQFTWNNIYEGATATPVGASLSGLWAGGYSGALTVVGVDSSDAAVSGRAGYYYNVEGTVSQFVNTASYKVYPVHNKTYYQSFFTADYDVSVIMDYKFVATETDAILDWNFLYGYGFGYSASNVDYNQKSSSWTSPNAFNAWNGRHSISLTRIVNNWASLLKVNSGAYFSLPRSVNDSTGYTGNISIYFGNVHIFTSAFKYINEYYLYNEESGEYELDETLTETPTAALGTTVNFNVKSVSDYAFVENNVNNVLTGTVLGNGTLVLKGYYIPCVENTINGLRNDATLDFGAGAIESYKVTQYVITTTNGTSGSGASTATVATETKHGIDVTAKYPDLFDEDGVADTSRLDGIYRIEAFAENNTIVIYNFEQYVDGQFTWNNIIEGQANYSDYVSGGMMNGYLWQNNGIYQGTATIETVTPTTDANLNSYIGGTTRDGLGITDVTGIYWKATASKPTSNDDGASLRVFACHSWNYYNTLWSGATITYNAFIRDPNNAVTNYSGGQVTVLGYVDSTGANYSSLTINKWITKSFTLNETTFTRLTCTNYSSSRIGGWFVGMRGRSIEIKGNSIEIYVGNITAVAAS